MRFLIKKYLASAISIYLVNQLHLGLIVENGFSGLTFAALVLLILLFIKPFIDTLLFPINLLTLNLTNWLTFIIFIYFWSLITPDVRFLAVNFSGIKTGLITIGPMMIPYWLSVIVMSLILIFLIKYLSWLFK